MKRTYALTFVGIAGALWASSGVAVQDFFAHSNKSAMDLTNIRMVISGLIMLILTCRHGRLTRNLTILKERPKMWLEVAVYGIIGIALVQFSYFEGISIGGAVPTTVIQYSCPAMIVLWNSVYNKKMPKFGEVLAAALAMIGVLLLVTGGKLDALLVPLSCVFWSLISGASFAFASIFPKHLFAIHIDQYFLTSVGMIIGGLFTFILVDEINWLPFFNADVVFDVSWIIIFGTVAAFLLFNVGLRYLTPEEASVTATTEPLASVIISYFMFGTAFGLVESLGIVFVITAILVPIFIDNRN